MKAPSDALRAVLLVAALLLDAPRGHAQGAPDTTRASAALLDSLMRTGVIRRVLHTPRGLDYARLLARKYSPDPLARTLGLPHATWPSRAFPRLDAFARAAGLVPLRLDTTAGAEVRLWLQGPFGDDVGMLRLAPTPGGTDTALLHFWPASVRERTDEGRPDTLVRSFEPWFEANRCGALARLDSLDVCTYRFDAPVDGNALYARLDSLGVWMLPDESQKTADASLLTDGHALYVELRRGRLYRTYHARMLLAEEGVAAEQIVAAAFTDLWRRLPPTGHEGTFAGVVEMAGAPTDSVWMRPTTFTPCGSAERWRLHFSRSVRPLPAPPSGRYFARIEGLPGPPGAPHAEDDAPLRGRAFYPARLIEFRPMRPGDCPPAAR